VTLTLSAGERLASARQNGIQEQQICPSRKGKNPSISEVSETGGFVSL